MKYLKKYELLKYDDPKIINDPVFPVIKSFEKLLNKLSELDNQGEIKKYFSNESGRGRMVLKYKKYGESFWPGTAVSRTGGNDIIEFSFTKSKNLDYKDMYSLLIQFYNKFENSYLNIFFKELKKLSMLYDDSNYNHNINLSFSFEDKDFNTIIDFLSNLTEELEFIHDVNNFNL